MIGNPSAVILDEPSTGMDPSAKRKMWRLIGALSSDKAILLTTHSMEECDFLCNRIGIMKKGRLLCIGSSQHLRTKYGNRYKLELRVANTNCVQQVNEFISNRFRESQLIEQQYTLLRYEFPTTTNLGELFALMEANKGGLQLEDYAVSQTTLEQIFISTITNEGIPDANNDNTAAVIIPIRN